MIPVPGPLLVAAIEAIRAGSDALLDRDWDCYSEEERNEAERYAETSLLRVAEELERLLAVAS
jgi:hypothetical protein